MPESMKSRLDAGSGDIGELCGSPRWNGLSQHWGAAGNGIEVRDSEHRPEKAHKMTVVSEPADKSTLIIQVQSADSAVPEPAGVSWQRC